MRRTLLSAALLAVALVFQLTVVNRLPLPGAGVPDLVLLTVVALGLCSSPAVGGVTGFCAGLGLDLAPPGSYLIGEYALVFCVIGYLCGRLRGTLNRSALLTIVLAIAAAAAGEALVALLGLMLSDPQVTWPAVRQVLPSAIAYDAVVGPFLLFAVMRVVLWADSAGRYGTAGEREADGAALLARAQAGGRLPGGAVPGGAGLGTVGLSGTVLGGAGLLGGAGWLAGPQGSRGSRASRGGARKGAVHTPRTPRLRQAAARPGDGWVGGGPRTGLSGSPRPGSARPARPGRPPRLRPGSGYPGSAAARPPRTLPPSSVNLRMGSARRRDGNIGRAPGFPGGGPAGSPMRARGRSGPPGSAFRSRRPAAGRPAGLARSSAGPYGPRFRPDPRLPGGSASPGALPSGTMPRVLPSRRVTLRLASARRQRHSSVIGGGVLGGTVGLGPRRGPAARPVSLRLGSSRRGDGTVGGLAPGRRRLWTGSRQATPRFRSGPSVGGRSLFGRRAGKRARLSSGRTSFLTPWRRGRLGGRSTVWRIGNRRTGGLR